MTEDSDASERKNECGGDGSVGSAGYLKRDCVILSGPWNASTWRQFVGDLNL